MVGSLKRYTGIGIESVYGTPVAASRYIESICRLPPDHGWIIPDPIAAPSRVKYNLGAYRVRGNLGAFDVAPNNIGEIINAIMGNNSYAKTNPETGVYLHEWELGNDLDSYTLRLGAEHEERIVPGILFNQATFRGVHGENLQCTAEMVGPGAAESTGSLASLTRANLSQLQPFVYHQASGLLSIAGSDRSSYIYDFEITINNNVPADRGNFYSRYIPKIRRGDRTVNGKLSLYFDDDDEYDRFVAGTSFALDFRFTGPTITGAYPYYIRWYLPICIYLRECAHPIQPISEPAVIDAPFQAFYDATYTELQMRLQNAESGDYT